MKPPGDNSEEPPAVVYYVYPEEYDDYDEEWGTWELRQEELEAEYARRHKPEFYVDYDEETHTYSCTCLKFLKRGACFHVYQFRGTENVSVSKDYL